MRLKETFSSIKQQIFSKKENCPSCEAKITSFDLAGPFDKYTRDVVEFGGQEANSRLESLLLLNMSSYAQEARGKAQITQIATQAARHPTNGGGWTFRDSFYDDVGLGWQQTLEQTKNEQIKNRYNQEFSSWMRVWQQHLSLVDDLDNLSSDVVGAKLSKKGFSLMSEDEGLEVSQSLTALFPQLKEGDQITAYKSPQPLLVASPSFEHYHRGETTIARYSRLYFLPDVGENGEWVILEDGLFTGYTDQQIKEFLKLDAQQKELPKQKDDFFEFVAFLGQELQDMPPQVIFQMIIDQIGFFPQIKTGKNVEVEKEQNFDSQLELIMRIFEFEQQNVILSEVEGSASIPQHSKTAIHFRLRQISKVIEHSLLRANDLNVESLFNDYLSLLSDSDDVAIKTQSSKTFDFKVIQSYPDFMTRVQSLIDCGSGSILGGVHHLSPTQLQSVLGFDRFNIISSLSGKNITSRSQFEKIAKNLGKDAKRFSSLGKCQHCGAHTFLGECGWCVLCELKDDLGMDGGFGGDYLAEGSAPLRSNLDQSYAGRWTRRRTANDFLPDLFGAVA